ncbi:hypothetical protein HMPREF9193_00839 [Treponema lecithinolyticum ATCC 700332]|uniref:Uncharacterized protein n=1 Tax=Treponema lecithinolyticum ATCC 700332 TaxID=1321815 RepID=A0ABN0NZP1_TRELE|nr:hypothetical protein HMPREF9193_00839 [Treponema lecithinolyticum ATCC 700332]
MKKCGLRKIRYPCTVFYILNCRIPVLSVRRSAGILSNFSLN